MDRKFVAAGLGFGLLGLILGIVMGASHNHTQLATHAHLMLAGMVLSFIYGVCHKLWLTNPHSGMASLQFYLHIIGTLVLTGCLFAVYGGHAAPSTLEPLLIISSLSILIALILMKVMFIKSK